MFDSTKVYKNDIISYLYIEIKELLKMLSVCIPVYNYDVSGLVNGLYNQLALFTFPFEILIMDDDSDATYKQINSEISLPDVHYIQLSENIGRSKIRNALANKAQFPYLIFMDCDSQLTDAFYIKNYLPYCKPGIVCYGGRIYMKERPAADTLLRWKYGVKRESAPASERRIYPNYGFCSNNFLIDKKIFEQIRFNEAITGYGHEDTFLGLELLGHGITIEHIDNPLIHMGLEKADAFLSKTENGILNLNKIEFILKEKYPEYQNHSQLMKSKIFIKKYHLKGLFKCWYAIFKSLLKKNLLGNTPSLFIFDLYRLGYLLNIPE